MTDQQIYDVTYVVSALAYEPLYSSPGYYVLDRWLRVNGIVKQDHVHAQKNAAKVG